MLSFMARLLSGEGGACVPLPNHAFLELMAGKDALSDGVMIFSVEVRPHQSSRAKRARFQVTHVSAFPVLRAARTRAS